MITNEVLMVRPSCFGFNPDTSSTNSFQQRVDEGGVNERAQKEFDDMVAALEKEGIKVIKAQDVTGYTGTENSMTRTPDSIFPNNWVSTYSRNGKRHLVLYPMCGANRRTERLGEATKKLQERADFTDDMTSYEKESKFLEGTGSMVLDHENKICFSAISPRTDSQLVAEWCAKMGYEPILFTARRSCNQELFYHTNVLMSVCPEYAIVCLDVIDPMDRERVTKALSAKPSRPLIAIAEDQADRFCGNTLALRNSAGSITTVMSTTAANAFSTQQKDIIGHICAVNIPTIETVGGGSARCMLAEIFW
ncbi:amidinotransferase [Gregarina niphandrodes]|uniref:Amidinotransferase n=1 Tax=Gregarina niphandrodes TaxID=110365 RepID=A0A023BBF0_GRENI|nr:amidinotransferase [Gregarina niphandrodes]EZG79707.1 amidinotransferase [Gregarina niphandrodes]|eukprot:XP_011134389.1 amidinotransferase [Gregarina niphandrodes]